MIDGSTWGWGVVQTVALLMTDVVGSTRAWREHPSAMDVAMRAHHRILHEAVDSQNGRRPVDQGEGDAVFASFPSVLQAVEAAASAQRQLAACDWPAETPLTVRMAVHAGDVIDRDGNLFGDTVNRCARIRGLASGGQTLVSAGAHELVRDKLPEGTALADLGEHRMKDLVRPERVWQLDVAGLQSDFPPLASLDAVLHNLPVQRSPLIGREADVARVVRAMREHRLVTLTGFGGMGKTRLSLQVAAELVEDFPDGVWFVDLAEVTDPEHVPGVVARAAGIKAVAAVAVTAELAGTRTLLVLDNVEQVLGAAPFVASLLDAAAGVRVLVTSRAPLRVRGEHEIALSPLALPPQGGLQDASGVSAFAAVQLFIDRAVAVRADFAVTNDNAPAVAEICHRLDGHPLAIELAAARVKMMTPQALLPRLDKALSVLTGGSRDMPDRHQTLRATIAWSYDNLSSDEQLLLQRVSVLPADADFAAIEAVCGDGLDVFEVLASLVDKSLVRVLTTDTEDRYGLLSSIRAYAAEHAAHDQSCAVQERHFDWYTALFCLIPPISRQDSQRQDALMVRELAHVAACWQLALADADPARRRDFPLEYGGCLMWNIGDLPAGVAVLQAVVSSSRQPTVALFGALFRLYNAAEELGAVIAPEHEEAMRATARALDRPDVDLHLACHDYELMNSGDSVRLRAAVEHMQVLLSQVPADSPFSAEYLHDLVDNMTYVYLMDVDPMGALVAARLNAASGSMGVLGQANLAIALARVGLHEEAVKRFATLVEAGVPHLERKHAWEWAASVAQSMVAVGEAPRARDLLRLWQGYLQGRPEEPRVWGQRVEAYVLTALGELQAAIEVLNQIPAEQRAGLGIALMFHRIHRLGSGPTGTAEVDHEIDAWRALPPADRRLDTHLSLLVERAAREPDASRRHDLAKAADQERGVIHLPWGYQADLDRLLAEV